MARSIKESSSDADPDTSGAGSLSDEEIRALLDDELREALEDVEESHLRSTRPMSPDDLEDHLYIVETLLAETREALATNDHAKAANHVDSMLEERGLVHRVDRSGLLYRKLCRELLKIRAKVLETQVRHANGEYEDGAPVASKKIDTAPRAASSPAPKLRELIRSYAHHHTLEGARRWAVKTEAAALACLELFAEVVGDVPADQIDRKMVAAFKDKLVRLPANLRKTPEYRDKGINDVIAMPGVKPMSVSSINKHLAWLSSLFRWAVLHGHIRSNPASGLKVPKSKRVDQERDVFTSEDAKLLISSADKLKHRFPYQYWLPLLGLYTGARLEELCGLRREDVYELDGVQVIHIRPHEERLLKTKAAERVIPVHSELKRREFFKFATEGRGDRVFLDLKRGRDGYGTVASKWFRRYRERIGLRDGLTFHSTRHAFATALKNADVPEVAAAELLGHEHPNISYSRYGKRHKPAKLVKWVELVRYPI
jgi:integrase